MRSPVHYRSFSHWFSYNWGWLLGAAAVIALIAFQLCTNSRDPKPDYVISWVGASSLSEEEVSAISTAAAQAGADQNGDGQVVVSVYQYIVDFTLSPDDNRYQNSYAEHLKLMAHIQSAESYLYRMDNPEDLQASTGVLQYLDGTIPAEDGNYECANWADMCVPWQPEGLERQCWLGRRVFFDGSAQTRFPGSDELFAALSG